MLNKNKYKKPIYAIREDSNDSNSNNSENDGNHKQLWCICRSEDGARFMICCDSCEEWYHGDCVNITPKQSELISKYFCAQCQKRNSSLKIQYKSVVPKRPKEFQMPLKVDKPYKLKNEEILTKSEKTFKSKFDERLNDPVNIKFDKSYKFKEDRVIDQIQFKYEKLYKQKSDDRYNESPLSKYDKQYKSKADDKFTEPTLSKYDKLYKNKSEEKSIEKLNKSKLDDKLNESSLVKPFKTKSDDKLFDSAFKDIPSSSKFDKVIKMKSEEKVVEPIIKFTQKPVKPGCCGECLGCLRKVDCNFCINCKSKSGKDCLKRVCQMLKVNKDQGTKAEKLTLTKLPGEFIPITKAAVPKKPVVRNLQNSSKLNLASSSSPSSNENLCKPLKRARSLSSSSESSSVSSKQKIVTSNTNKLPPPKKSKVENDLIPNKIIKSKFIESSESSEENMDEDEEIEDEDMDDESDDSNDENGDSSDSFVLRKQPGKTYNKIAQRIVKKKISQNNFNERNETRSVSPFVKPKYQRKITQPRINECKKQYKPIECHNIGCNKNSRIGSKYCSEECGLKLAEQRLLKYLPSRINNWNNSVSICNQRDRRNQVDIGEECETIQHNLNILDKSHHDLIEFIDRWRSACSASINTDDEDRRPPGANDDSVQCVTCGYMVGSTKALAHMENCYQKIEGGTMVFADFEEQPIGSKLFCDFYDNNIRGYCKRLAALCDHNKDSKVDPKTICAFPLSVNEKSDKVCMTAKIKCNRHVNWERIQRAVIDMNRYRLLVRYEELQVEERKFKHNIGQRGGVMSLLLHETIDHQPMKPLLPIRNKCVNKKMRKFTKAKCI